MNSKEIKEKFLFQENNNFYCPCGENYTVNKKEGDKEEYTIKIENDSFKNMDVSDFIKNVDLAPDEKCPKCERSPADFKKMGLKQDVNIDFFKSFLFEETSSEILLHKKVFKGFFIKETKVFIVKEKLRSIVFDKETKSVKIKDENKKIDVELENLFNEIQNFYEPNDESSIKIIDNLIDIHIFIGRLANFLRDFKNINFVSGLMEEINGTRGLDVSKGLGVLVKVTCTLLAIAQYESLATIALVKSGLFLFELLKDCELPSSKKLKELNLTKPIQIFNYLINLEAKKIQDDIDKNNKDIQQYAFKSIKLQSGQEIVLPNMKIIHDENIKNSETKIRKGANGSLILKEGLETKKISPFLFKKIKTVKEYKSLIRYCKFIDYNDLLNLTMKYDSVFLDNLFDYIEFRGDIDKESLSYFINLYADFFSKQNSEYCEKEFKDYLICFDDAKMMLVSLKWNVKKELMGIKKCYKLEEYHNWLVKQYNSLIAKNGLKIDYQNFVDKYRSLEDYKHPDIEIKLIDTVEGLFFWAKQLNNSAAAYASKVVGKIYLMAIVNYKTYKQDSEVPHLKNFMLGLDVDKRNMLEFDQFKSTNNQLASNKLRLILMEYLRDKDISYKELADLSLIESNNKKAKEAEFMYNTDISIEDTDIQDYTAQ